MKLVFMGTPDFAAECLRALIENKMEVAAVFTKEDKPVGRGHRLAASPVKEVACSAGIPVYQPHRVKDDESYRALSEIRPDLIIVAAYGQIIPQRILDLPKFGCINVHASLLPAYRGAAPIQWAVINGEEESGVTIMQMAAGLDTGDMIAKKIVKLAPDETGGSLFDRLSKEGAQLLIETIPKIQAGAIIPEKQPEESTTMYARMIKKSDGAIDWSRDAVSIERLIRGLNPWPSAYSYLGGKQVKFWSASVSGKESGKEPGAVFDVDKKGFSVQTGKESLRIRELQMTGKKRMTADAFLRGHALTGDERFVTEP
jgi:methionyl-tRNA formyltransferase